MVRRKSVYTGLALLLVALLGRPVAAECPQFEPLLSIAGVSGGVQTSRDQATLSAGGCVTLSLMITRQSGNTTTTTDESLSPNTSFFTDPTRGSFSAKNVFCVSTADCNHQFPVYARYFDTCSRTYTTATVHITVLPCVTVVSPFFMSCTPNQMVTATSGCSAAVTFPAPVASGTPTPTVTCTAPIGAGGSTATVTSGTVFPVGTTTVTCTASNTGGTAICTFTVKVLPSTLGVTCPGTQTLTAGAGSCSATLPSGLTFPTTNACGTTTLSFSVTGATTGTSLTQAQLLALAFNTGTSTVTVTATTTTGQTAHCSFGVTVTPPTLGVTCPGTQTLAVAAGSCTATLPSGLTFPTTNACGTVTLSFGVTGATTGSNLTRAQLLALAFNAGSSTVTVTATTTSGQTAHCSFSVMVTPPTLGVTCPGTQTLTGSATTCTATLPSSLTFPTTSACGTVTLSFGVTGATTGSNLTLAQLLALAFKAGTSTVTVTATTTSGQTAHCSFSVVVSVAAPTITCPPMLRVCLPEGTCAATGVSISPTVTPACATTTTIRAILPNGTTVSVPAGTALPPLPFGVTMITATATNVSGTVSCTSSVTVFTAGQSEVREFVTAVNGVATTGNPDQVTVSVGDVITLGLTVTVPGCPSFSGIPFSTFTTSAAISLGTVSGNTFTVGALARNHQFPIYGIFFNPCTGTSQTATIHVTVRP